MKNILRYFFHVNIPKVTLQKYYFKASFRPFFKKKFFSIIKKNVHYILDRVLVDDQAP